MRTSCARSVTSPRRAARAPIGRRRSSVARPRAAGLETIADAWRPVARRSFSPRARPTRRLEGPDRPTRPFAPRPRSRAAKANREADSGRNSASPFESRALPTTGEPAAFRRGSPPFPRVARKRRGHFIARDESDPLKLNGTSNQPRRATRRRVVPSGTDGRTGEAPRTGAGEGAAR